MTERKPSITWAELKKTLDSDRDFLKPLVELVMQEVLARPIHE